MVRVTRSLLAAVVVFLAAIYGPGQAQPVPVPGGGLGPRLRAVVEAMTPGAVARSLLGLTDVRGTTMVHVWIEGTARP